MIENEDEFDESGVAKISMTFLVMVETLCESVWAYAERERFCIGPMAAEEDPQ